MDRKEFIKKGAISAFFLGVSSSFANLLTKTPTPPPDQYRSVEGVFPPTNTHMVGDGFKVMNFFPNGRGFEERMSPFFLLDFNAEVNFPPSDISRGVGVHPHRGIETITFAYKGSIAHHDSAGNKGVINPGDVQWMTAGGGVLHKEYHEKDFDKQGGALEMVQLWINLPKKHKMVPAKYQSILHTDKPKIDLPGNMGSVHVVAGQYKGLKGIASAYSPVHIYDFHLNPNGVIDFVMPSNFNTGILVIDGSITVNKFISVPENHWVQLKNEPGEIHIKANERTVLLVLSGEDLKEPYVSYGPFVMNTQEEIHRAIEDYNAGKFGHLAD